MKAKSINRVQAAGLLVVLFALCGYGLTEVYKQIAPYRVTADRSELNDPTRTPRVLLIGNSLIYSNAMDVMATHIAADVDPAWKNALFTRITPSGYALAQHEADLTSRWKDMPKMLGMASSYRWNYVVLQDQSAMMTRVPGDPYRRASTAAIRNLAGLARANHATPLLMITWGYNPASVGGYELPEFYSMSDRIESGYRTVGASMQKQIPIGFVPAGPAFRSFAAQHGEKLAALYLDDRHPSEAGTYLAACTLVGRLTGKPTATVTWRPPSLSAESAATLRQIADEVVANETN